MLIADKITRTFFQAPDRRLTIPEIPTMLCTSQKHVRTGIVVRLTGKEIVAVGKRHEHGGCAMEYAVKEASCGTSS